MLVLSAIKVLCAFSRPFDWLYARLSGLTEAPQVIVEWLIIFQRELEFKVQILEWKVDSYKKLTESLDSTVESIRVKELLPPLTDHTQPKI